ncbi:MAG TPA: Spy/CpxP family protein refolding chaperone [Gemmatimonadaceae bacterium]|nr:Spy/CpxP family protein refolding chaperone [Gemmatimonadaceae bacterium]
MVRRIAVGLIALAVAAPLEAQRPGARPLQAQGIGDRARLEQEIRRGFAIAVRRRVGLNDAQMAKLGPIASRYEQQRRQLQAEERDARLALGQALRNESTADSKQVDGLLQRMIDIQKRRVSLVESEQHELATIMSPVQRARYLALQEQIRRRLEQARQRRQPSVQDDSDVSPAPLRRLNRRAPR